MSKLLRGGRVGEAREDVAKFTSSLESDRRIAWAVIKINQAHVAMLAEQGIIKASDGAKILSALASLDSKSITEAAEDIHLAIEEAVTTQLGEDVAGNMHLAKSRNDQVATAIRMELKRSLLSLQGQLLAQLNALLEAASSHFETIIPGYTHLQQAQPTSYAHYLLSLHDAFLRDLERLSAAYDRADLCPMGAGALAGTSFPINRDRVSDLLGFNGVLENSMDAVTARDFILEALAGLTILGVNLSRLAEDLIVWSTQEFGLVELPDEFASTSSIMPQKKNPDALELIRAKCGVIAGNFFAASAILKGLPSSYNLDLQEVTPRLWEALDDAATSISMISELVPRIELKNNRQRLGQMAFMTMTELANLLTRKYGVPFRIAHKIVGGVTASLLQNGKGVEDLDPGLIADVAKKFLHTAITITPEDISEATDPKRVLYAHDVKGGPSPKEVKRMAEGRRDLIASVRSEVERRKTKLASAEERLSSVVNSCLKSIKVGA